MSKQWTGSSGTPLKLRANRQTTADTQRPRLPVLDDEEDENPNVWLVERPPSSAVRYRPYYIDPHGNRVYQQGGKRIVVHPPRNRRQPHWTAIAIVGGIAALLLFAFVVWASNKWNDTLNDWTYTSTFRTFSINSAVGHNGDSLAHPSHFIVQNDHMKIVIIEFPKDDPGKVIVYYGPSLLGDGQDKVPITISFQFDTQTGRIDMLLHVEGQTYLFTNTGSKFVQPAQQ